MAVQVDSVEWLEPWQAVTEAQGRRLEEELRLELAAEHVIFGRPARALGTRCDCDDVLFEINDPPEHAVVHLAYAAHPDRPPWPTTELFRNLNDFVERRMKPDHSDYVDEAD